ncbi:transposable element Tcb1 transposase [Trichonephila clavipes]|nr:transposable element Tcb1 transposase [Trichonephila clavipes]
MSSRHHIDDFMRGRIIGKIEEGRKITDVAREFDIAHSVVSRLWKSFKTTGMCSRQHGGGRVRSTTPAEDRYIVISAKRNRRTTAQQVANQFLAASGKQISRKTVARRLRGGGLYARRPVVCVPLTRQHRTARLQWCREHHNWTEQDWACVLFSDESRFSLSSDCRRQLIWRESGTAYRKENIQEKDPYPTCSIMVWAGIMINGRTRLHVVANGTMTDQRYIDEVLLPHNCLDSEGIQRLVWPARYPDLNPIENVWVALGRQVAGRNYPPTNKNTLIRALTEEWDKLSQQLLDNVVQSSVCSAHGILEAQVFHMASPLFPCLGDQSYDPAATPTPCPPGGGNRLSMTSDDELKLNYEVNRHVWMSKGSADFLKVSVREMKSDRETAMNVSNEIFTLKSLEELNKTFLQSVFEKFFPL